MHPVVMDEVVQKALESICCAKRTSLHYFDTREHEAPDRPLYEQQILERIQELVHSMVVLKKNEIIH